MFEGTKNNKNSGIDRRRLLRGMVIGAGAIAGGGINAVLDSEPDWEGLKTPEEKIDYFRKVKGGFDADNSFKKRAMEPSIKMNESSISLAEYVQRIFIETVPKKIPEDSNIRRLLATVAPGIPAQETRYNNNLVSNRAGARYLWQFTNIGLKDINNKHKTQLKMDDIKDVTVSTALAFAYFDEVIYSAIQKPVNAVLEKFNLSGNPDAVDQFMVYCMINAYNAGIERVSKVLTAFAKSYNPKGVRPVYEYTPLSLFHAMSERTMRLAGSLDAGYKKESAEYAFRVLAGAESINAQYKLQYSKTLADSMRQTRDTFLQQVGEPAIAGIGGALVGGALGRILTRNFSQKEELSSESGIKEPTRRKLLQKAILTALTAGGIGISANKIVKDGIHILKLPDISMDMWWRIDKQKVSENTPLIMSDGTIYNSHVVREKFGNDSLLFDKPVTIFDLKKLPTKNLTSSGIAGYIKNQTKEKNFAPVNKSDIENNTSTYSKNISYVVKPVTLKWRCRGIGMGKVQTGDNNASYLRLRPEAGKIFERVADNFQTALVDAGISKEWHVRPIINSLLRSADSTNNVEGASKDSPHTYGVGFDISLSRFDIINTASKEFFMTSSSIDDRATDLKLVQSLDSIMANVLQKLHNSRELVLTFEPGHDHWHVSAIKLP